MQENNILFLQKIENVAWKACRGEGVNFCNESIFFSGSCSLKDQMCVSGDAWKWNKMYNHPTRSHTCQEETWRNITSRIKVGTASSCLPGADIQVAGQKDKNGEIYIQMGYIIDSTLRNVRLSLNSRSSSGTSSRLVFIMLHHHHHHHTIHHELQQIEVFGYNLNPK